MKKITDFLEANKVQYFATIGLDGKPKVRPFQFMFVNNHQPRYGEYQDIIIPEVINLL